MQFAEGINTSDIHEIVVKAAADLISTTYPNYQTVAARLAMFGLRKKAFGQYEPPSLAEHVTKMVHNGVYDKSLIENYDLIELNELNSVIDHSRDLNFSYAAMKQLEGKYFAQNRVTGKIYESAQFVYMGIAMALFSHYEKSVRLDFIKRFYEAASKFKLSLPTPIMSGARTPTRQFSSCVLVDSGDSLDSINATASSIVKYISQRAGIGVNIGRIRAIGSEIRGGEAYHTGLIPFIKHFHTAVKSCSQGGVRGGAATAYYPIWHLEAESLIVLKNNKGVEENRVRHLDYGVQLNKLMYQRLIKGQNITLFSPHEVPGLYDAFFQDQALFEKLYTEAENNPDIRKKVLKAVDLMNIVAQERAGTGRIYIQNVDHTNEHGAFLEKVATTYMSNLCLEITLPTKSLDSHNDENGEIALCTLAAFNLGAMESEEDFEEVSELIVRSLDALLDYQDYPMEAAKHALGRRALGAGVTNLAYFLAKNGVKYSDGSANNLVHRTMEKIQFNLLKASNKLAKEVGACEYFNETKYSKGILPIDTYKKDIDVVHSQELLCDWEGLRADIKKHGLRNSTLTALMPCETSSQITNSTNGIEPPRGYVSVKASKDGIFKQVVPEYERLKDQYELLWDIPDNKGYLQLVGIMTKFIDQAASANTNYDPARFEDGRVPIKLVLQDLMYAYKMGLKTLYYHNTRDGADDGSVEKDDGGCAGGACSV
ncbi:ribonucleoside-diphosphate reductase 1 subunit alpha [uncultured Thiomicrorhabdus sp.]